MKIIVGLGNPGREYEKTRHNIGFRVLENLVQSAKCNPFDKLRTRVQSCSAKFKVERKLKSELVELEIGDDKVLLVKPETFMNRSGEAISAILNMYKDRININDVIVIHDDSDLELGKIKIKKGGGSGGHHGIESIVKSIGEDSFIRIKIGIRTEKEGKAMEMVLRPFNSEEEKILKEVINRASEAVLFVLTEGLEKGMSRYNIK